MDIYEIRATELAKKQWLRYQLHGNDSDFWNDFEVYQRRRIKSLREESQTYGSKGLQETLF